jgi:hypothetical protein
MQIKTPNVTELQNERRMNDGLEIERGLETPRTESNLEPKLE